MIKKLPWLAVFSLLAGCLREFEPLAMPDAAETVAPVDAGGGQTVTLRNPLPDMSLGGDRSGRDVFLANVFKPMMEARCVPCHGVQGGIGPSFIKPDPYDSIIAYPGMITRDPTHSLLITKGTHDGSVYFSP